MESSRHHFDPSIACFLEGDQCCSNFFYKEIMYNLGHQATIFKSCLKGLSKKSEYLYNAWCWPDKRPLFDLKGDSSTQEQCRRVRRGIFISLPLHKEPHECIRHLFLDFQGKIEEGFGQYNWRRPTWMESIISKRKTWLSDSLLESFDEHEKYAFALFDDVIWDLVWDNGLEHLSLGTHASHLLAYRDVYLCAKDVTIVITSEVGNPWAPYKLGTLSRYEIDRLHLIGINLQDSEKGLPPPWDIILECKRAFYGDRLEVAHIRYDTSRSAFKPKEFAESKELQDFLTEVTFRTHPPIETANLTSLIVLDDDEYPLAQEMGSTDVQGYLELLQFAWEPMSSLQSNSSAAINCETDNAAFEAITTDDYDKSRHTDIVEAKDELATELQKEVTALYGWDAPGIVPVMDYIKCHGATSKDRCPSIKPNHAFSPVTSGSRVLKIQLEGSQVENDALDWVGYNFYDDGDESQPLPQCGIRAPNSLIHFGGKAALTREDRLVLFEARAYGGDGAWPC